jgi:hypothetical protein
MGCTMYDNNVTKILYVIFHLAMDKHTFMGINYVQSVREKVLQLDVAKQGELEFAVIISLTDIRTYICLLHTCLRVCRERPRQVGPLSPQHAASSGFGWRDGLQLWSVATSRKRKGVALQLGSLAWG